MSDPTYLISVLVFPVGIAALGLWAVFLTRRTDAQAKIAALASTQSEYADISKRLDAIEQALEQRNVRHGRTVVRPDTWNGRKLRPEVRAKFARLIAAE